MSGKLHLHRASSVVVTGLAPSGAGTAEIDGLPVLLPGALPGDVVDCLWEPPKPGGRQGLAREVRLLTPSPDRDASRCPLAGACGGCAAAGLAYEAELSLKCSLLLEVPLKKAGLLRAGLLESPAAQPESARRGFRNKAILYPALERTPQGGLAGRFGYYRARSHRVVPAENCPQTPRWMHEAARDAASLLVRGPLSGTAQAPNRTLRALCLREAPGTRERLVTIVSRRPLGEAERKELRELIEPLARRLNLAGVALNVNPNPGNAVLAFGPDAVETLFGHSEMRARIGGLEFEATPLTFLQVNSAQIERLYAEALKGLDLKREDRFLDLYCGVGTLTLLGARCGCEAAGIERVEASVERARRNALLNGLERVQFSAGPVEALLEETAASMRPNKVMLDPAHRGVERSVLEALARMPVERLVYVACGAAAFVRDASELVRLGFRLERVLPVDLFPGSLNIETIGVFSRQR